ncbi:MAG: globin [Candidatus Limnocylindrales bacterium]
MIEHQTFFDRVGGMPFFDALVAAFYRGVATDDILRPLYPESDLAPAKRRLTLFLVQYWGGPRTYEAERGHPRLRMRHAPFAIDAAGRDRWLTIMRGALAEVTSDRPIPPEAAAELDRYLEMAAESMRNRA